MRNLSEIYKYAHEITDSAPQNGIYEHRQKSLAKQVKKEIAGYKKRSAEQSGLFSSNKRIVWIIFAIAIIVVLAIVIVVMNQKTDNGASGNSATNSAPDNQIIEGTDEVDKSTKSADLNSEVETSADVITQEPINIVVSMETEFAELSDENSTSDVFEKDSAESYNGYNLGDLVYYSGTVHYAASNTNQLSGACKGGIAMISGINPDGIHKFHLVAADENCTVYGWVDEVFIKPADYFSISE